MIGCAIFVSKLCFVRAITVVYLNIIKLVLIKMRIVISERINHINDLDKHVCISLQATLINACF